MRRLINWIQCAMDLYWMSAGFIMSLASQAQSIEGIKDKLKIFDLNLSLA
jgi:hypothetical protein